MTILLIGACGYVGNVVYSDLVTDKDIVCVDILERGNPGNIPMPAPSVMDYRYLTAQDLADFDTIILLGAVSSRQDNGKTFETNIVGFNALLNNITHQRLIYASSAAVYSGFGRSATTEKTLDGCTMYDLSKLVNDHLAALSGKECYGLRFGTINGPSPNISNNLMMNAMVHTARTEGYVRVNNVTARRPILGISDVTRAIRAVVEGPKKPGVYNLASFNSTVGELASAVSATFGVPIHTQPDTPTYDCVMSAKKFERAYRFKFQATAESIIADLMEKTS